MADISHRASLNESQTDKEFLLKQKQAQDRPRSRSEHYKSKAKKFLIQGDHVRCADFEESHCKCCSKRTLLVIRILLFVPMLSMLIYTLNYNPINVAQYESYWTFVITIISLFTSMMAHYSKWWHSLAVYTSELSMCFNICVVPVFWYGRGPSFPADWAANRQSPPYDPKDTRWYLFQMAFVHSTPILTSVTELLITKMCFLKKDSKWIFLVAILYIPVNYWAFISSGGTPIYNYPYLDWKDWRVTFGAFVFQAFVMALFNSGIAHCTQSRMGFVENLKHRVEILEKHNAHQNNG